MVVKKKKQQKNPHAAALGKLGGKARLTKLTAEKRTEVARQGAQARWAKEKGRGK